MNFRDLFRTALRPPVWAGLLAGGVLLTAHGDDPATLDASRWLSPEMTRPLDKQAIPYASVQATFDSALTGGAEVTLPDGRIVDRARALKELEDIQRGLAAGGRTLLDGEGNLGTVAETVVPAADLTDQGGRILGSIRDHDPTSMPPVLTEKAMTSALDDAVRAQETPSLDRLYKHAVAKGTEHLPALPVIRAPRFDVLTDLKTKTHKDWNATYGKASTFLATVDAGFDLSGKSDAAQVNVQANAGIRVFDSPRVDVLRAEGITQAPASGNVKARGAIVIAGSQVFDEGFEVGVLRESDAFESPILGASTKFRFMVGPVPLSGTLGVNGSAGLDFTYEATLLNAGASFSPNISGDGFAEVAVDLEVASAGAGGTLKVIEAASDLKGLVRVDFEAEGGPTLEAVVDSQSRIELLSGTLYAFVRTMIPWPPFEKRFQRDVYAWDGIRKDLGRTIAFRKRTTPRGIVLQGDADPEDAVATDLDRYERDRVEVLLVDAKARESLLARSEGTVLEALDAIEKGALADFWTRFSAL